MTAAERCEPIQPVRECWIDDCRKPSVLEYDILWPNGQLYHRKFCSESCRIRYGSINTKVEHNIIWTRVDKGDPMSEDACCVCRRLEAATTLVAYDVQPHNHDRVIRRHLCADRCVTEYQRLFKPDWLRAVILATPAVCWGFGCNKVGEFPHQLPGRLVHPCNDHLGKMVAVLLEDGYKSDSTSGVCTWGKGEPVSLALQSKFNEVWAEYQKDLQVSSAGSSAITSSQGLTPDAPFPCFIRGCGERGLTVHILDFDRYSPCGKHYDDMVQRLLRRGYSSVLHADGVRWLTPAEVQKLQQEQAKEALNQVDTSMRTRCYTDNCPKTGPMGHVIHGNLYYPCTDHLQITLKELMNNGWRGTQGLSYVDWAQRQPSDSFGTQALDSNHMSAAIPPKPTIMDSLKGEMDVSKKLILGHMLVKASLAGYRLAVEKTGANSPKLLRAIVALAEEYPEEAEILLAGSIGGIMPFTPGDKPQLLEDAASGMRMNAMTGVGVKTMEALIQPGMQFLKEFDWKSWMPQAPAGILDYAGPGQPLTSDEAKPVAKTPEVKA